MAFNKGPAYGLSAEVKNKVGGRFWGDAQTLSNFFFFFFLELAGCTDHLGLHFAHAELEVVI